MSGRPEGPVGRQQRDEAGEHGNTQRVELLANVHAAEQGIAVQRGSRPAWIPNSVQVEDGADAVEDVQLVGRELPARAVELFRAEAMLSADSAASVQLGRISSSAPAIARAFLAGHSTVVAKYCVQDAVLSCPALALEYSADRS
jgi:hypothetical protein